MPHVIADPVRDFSVKETHVAVGLIGLLHRGAVHLLGVLPDT